MKIIGIVSLAQIVSWAVFILEDFLTETTSFGGDSGSAIISVLVLPLLVSVLYLIFKEKIHMDSIPDWVNTMTVLFTWTAENIFVSTVIANLMGKGKWIIHQADDGWENLLNGIEYAFFPLFNIIAPLAVVALWYFGKWILKKMGGYS